MKKCPPRSVKLVLSPANRAKMLAKLPAPVAAEIKQAEKKQALDASRKDRRAAAHKLLSLLRERFPAAFRVPRPPLAIGIHRQILEVAGPEIDRHELGRFLKWWCSRHDYLNALAHGEARVNLDGSAAGAPTEEQQLQAARRLKGPLWGDEWLARIKARQV